MEHEELKRADEIKETVLAVNFIFKGTIPLEIDS